MTRPAGGILAGRYSQCMKGNRLIRSFALSVFVALIAQSTAAADLTLTWDPPQDVSVAGYVIGYGTEPGVYTAELIAGAATRATVANLVAGVSYYFVVQSYNEAGERSDRSNEIVATAAATPGHVTALTLTGHLPSPQSLGAAIQWTATPSGGVAPYHYEWTVSGGGAVTQMIGWSSASTFSWTPAVAGNDYAISVAVRSDGGSIAEMIQQVAFTITEPPPPPPMAATSITLTSNMTSPQALGTIVQWRAAASGGVAPYQYRWTVVKDGVTVQAGTWASASTLDWTPTAAGTGYVVGVAARSQESASVGGEVAQQQLFTITALAPPPPPPAPLAVANLTLINANTDQPVAGHDPLSNGTVLRLSQLPGKKLNIRANISGIAARVVLRLDGRFLTADHVAPYSLAGDKNGDYAAWTPPTGRHILEVTPYATNGTVGATYSFTFTVEK
jgi:hypothetical protein